MNALHLLRRLQAERSCASAPSSTPPSLPADPPPPAHSPSPIDLHLPPDLLARHALGLAPRTVAYVPAAISALDEAALLAAVYAAPPSRWVQLRRRRLQVWGGTVQPGGGLSSPEPLPPWLACLADGLVDAGVYEASQRPNHVLVNEYAPGQGILAHTDGPAYFPRTSTLSLGSDAVMRLYVRGGGSGAGEQAAGSSALLPVCDVVLRRASLVVFGDAAYATHLHAIEEVEEDVLGAAGVAVVNLDASSAKLGELLTRGTRVSLTIRHVPEVLGVGRAG